MLYHLLKSTLHLKANACSIGTFIRFYMQSSLHSKANACNIGTFIRFYIQMRVQIKNKAFAYRFYRPFTQQCNLKNMSLTKLLFLLKPPKFYKNWVSWIWRELFKLARKWKLTWICITPAILRCIRCYVDLSSNLRRLLNFSYFKIRKQSPLSWNLNQLSIWIDNCQNQMAVSEPCLI